MRTAQVWAGTALGVMFGAILVSATALACAPAEGPTQVEAHGATRGEDIVLLEDGSIYAAGVFRGSTDFDPGPGVDQRTAKGGFDVFVTKYRPDGSYAWTRTLGSAADDESLGLSSSADGTLVLRARQAGRSVTLPLTRISGQS